MSYQKRNRRYANSNRSKSSPKHNYTLLIINMIALIAIVLAIGTYFFFRQDPIAPSIPVNTGMGNTPANSSNYAYSVCDDENTYLANYNKIGTIVKRNNSGNEETFVNLNTDSVNIYGLNIYGDNLYFIVANNAGQQSIYQKSLAGADAAHPLVTINRTNKNYLIPIIFADSIFVLASDSANFSNPTSSELIKYDLAGNEVISTSIDSSRITSDGGNLFSLTNKTVSLINPVDLTSTPIFNFAASDEATGNEFFYYDGRLYIPCHNLDTDTNYIGTLTLDGTQFETVLSENISNNGLTCNVSDYNLFIIYSIPDNSYLFTQTDLNTGVEKNVFETVDNYPNIGIMTNTPVKATYMYTAPNGVYYLRVYDADRDDYTVGIYSFIAYNTKSAKAVGNFFYKE